MKLYATIISDKAKKIQGGNKFIAIHLKIGSALKSLYVASVSLLLNEKSNNYELHLSKNPMKIGKIIGKWRLPDEKKPTQQTAKSHRARIVKN